MTQDFRRSPLAHRSALADPSGRIALDERPFTGLLVLRGDRAALNGAVRDGAGLELPSEAGTFSQADDTSALWIGPDEWVLVTRPGAEGEMLSGLKSALAATHSQVVDVTDYYTPIIISGIEARTVLAKITMVDLHPRAFSKGNAIASLFGHAGAWLQMIDDEDGAGPTFALYVRRSMADYLWCLLADGGREFGLEPQEPIGQVKLHLPHFERAS